MTNSPFVVRTNSHSLSVVAKLRTRTDGVYAVLACLLACTSLSAGPLRIRGVEIDDLPLLGPYLLPTQTPHNSIRVAFRGTEPDTLTHGGTLSYGLQNPNEQALTFSVAPSHVVELNELTPGTNYHYQLKLGSYQSPVYHFRTAPAPGTRADKINILILSDIHAHSPQDVAAKPGRSELWFSRYREKMADMRTFAPDIVLLPGDIVHVGGRREEYETIFRLMRDLFATALVLPCPGNHERQKDPKLINYADFFPDPVPVMKTGAWALTYGGIGFVTHGRRAWLKDTLDRLQTEGRTDTIVYTRHEPVYLWSDKGTNTGLSSISKIFDQAGGVRLCIYGHFHMHQRTFPLLHDAVETTERSNYDATVGGTIYLQIPSVWYQYASAREDPFVAHNGVLADGGPYSGFTEMVIKPEEIITETFGYSETGERERTDRFTLKRKKP